MTSKVLIGIPTFARPEGLRRTLTSIAAMTTKHDVAILVVNNDPQGCESTEAEIKELREEGYRFPIRLAHESRRGISQARNRIIDETLALRDTDILAMIDDDEYPSCDWIDQLVATHQELSADVVGGPVERVFEDPSIPEFLRIHHQSKAMHQERRLVDFIGSTANISFRTSLLRSFPSERFDVEFGLTGGGDYEYLKRLKKINIRFAWAPGALVYETFPASRSSIEWTLQRAYRTANAETRVALKHREIRSAAKLLLSGMLNLVVTRIGRRQTASPSSQFLASVRAMRARGKLDAFRGRRHDEYATIHGR